MLLTRPLLNGSACVHNAGTMTCSDKIARWNVLGVQGALLSAWLEPLYLSAVVVGRKYSFEHARRALCCRLAYCPTVAAVRERVDDLNGLLGDPLTVPAEDTPGRVVAAAAASTVTMPQQPRRPRRKKGKHQQYPPLDRRTYGLRHPALAGTAVKLDEAVIQTAATTATAPAGTTITAAAAVVVGACFECGGGRETACLVWSRREGQGARADAVGGGAPERIDGRTGRRLPALHRGEGGGNQNRGAGGEAIGEGEPEAEPGVASISRRSLFRLYLRALANDRLRSYCGGGDAAAAAAAGADTPPLLTYEAAKRDFGGGGCGAYCRARAALLTGIDFREWCVSDPALDQWGI